MESTMGPPYRARVEERRYLDFRAAARRRPAYVFAFVEDTSESDLRSDPSCGDTCSCCPDNFEPRIGFELGDGGRRFAPRLRVEEPWRGQSLHALDTLTAALQATRQAVVAEGDEFDRRERLLEEHRNIGS
jgi:hypothetical protein